MPPRPRRDPQTYPGGRFVDPEWIPDPSNAKASAPVPDRQQAKTARKATKAGPPPGFPPMVDDDQAPTPATPPADKPRAPAARSAGGDLPRPSLTPSISDGGGFLFGMLLYTLGINYLRNGMPGVKGWFGAKFLNHQNNFANVPGGTTAAPQHVTPGLNQPQYSIPYDGKQ